MEHIQIIIREMVCLTLQLAPINELEDALFSPANENRTGYLGRQQQILKIKSALAYIEY